MSILNSLCTAKMHSNLRRMFLVWTLIFACSQLIELSHAHDSPGSYNDCILCAHAHDIPALGVTGFPALPLENSCCFNPSFVHAWADLAPSFYDTRAPPQI